MPWPRSRPDRAWYARAGRRRTRAGAGAVPGWMKAIDELTGVRAAGSGVLLAAVNPKNLLLCLSAGVVIGSGGIVWADRWLR